MKPQPSGTGRISSALRPGPCAGSSSNSFVDGVRVQPQSGVRHGQRIRFGREELQFHLALTKPEAERSAWLDRECGDDPALRARLDVLLAAHARSETLLAGEPEAALRDDASTRPPAATLRLHLTDAPGEAVGQTLGRYKLLERVGEGGCGVVYVAEQTEPFRRRVALKVIKLGMDTKQVVARFEAERQALP